MKSIRFLLSLLFILYTFNLRAQIKESEFSYINSVNTEFINMPVVIYSQSIDGFVYVNNQEQSIWQGQNYYEYTLKNTVKSGDILTIEAWILGKGILNTTKVRVPENAKNPLLNIYVVNENIPSVGAYISEY